MNRSARREDTDGPKRQAPDPWEDEDDDAFSEFDQARNGTAIPDRTDDPYRVAANLSAQKEKGNEGEEGGKFLEKVLRWGKRDTPFTASSAEKPSPDPHHNDGRGQGTHSPLPLEQEPSAVTPEVYSTLSSGKVETRGETRASMPKGKQVQINSFEDLEAFCKERGLPPEAIEQLKWKLVSIMYDQASSPKVCLRFAMDQFFDGALFGLGIGTLIGIRDFGLQTRGRPVTSADVRVLYRKMGRMTGTMALVLTVASSTKCVLTGIRKKRDHINPIVGGALAGGLWAILSRRPRKSVGLAIGAGLGAICSFLDPKYQVRGTPVVERPPFL